MFRSYIGLGYHDTITPSVILRMVMENPGWYTPYTPYQAEIAQGRLESLLNFQTMVTDLTGMEVANASLLDEATAAAEAMTLLRRVTTKKLPVGAAAAVPRQRSLLPADDRRAADARRTARDRPADRADRPRSRRSTREPTACCCSIPTRSASCRTWRPSSARAHDAGVLVAVATDLLALTLFTPPGEMGADVVVGNSQRFGVPLGYGGPHAAFFATRQAFVRQMPGRIIGVSVDAHGRTAYRMALATREQHIRREKATSNICTAQALLANMAAMYAVYHGPEGLQEIATRVHSLTIVARRHADESRASPVDSQQFFDTLRVEIPGGVDAVRQRALGRGINLRYVDDRTVGISLNETTTFADVEEIAVCLADERQRVDGIERDSGRIVPSGPGMAAPHDAVPDAPGLQLASFRNADDAVHPHARAQGHRPRPLDDPARLVHDEAERRQRDAAGHLGALRPHASVRAGGPGAGLRADRRRARGGALRDHRLRRRVAAAEFRRTGRVRRSAGDPRLPARHEVRRTATSC